jgi:hypothetical protein
MKKKTAALKTGEIAVRSAKLPALPEPVRFRDFIEFEIAADELDEYFRDLRLYLKADKDDPRMAADIEEEAGYCAELRARVQAGFERFDRRHLYDEDDESLSHAYVAQRIGVLVGSFPNANPGSPDVFMKMLVEHVAAIGSLTDVALESACREIVEESKFLPVISEVVKTIKRHAQEWWGRRKAMQMVESTRLELIKVLVKREADKKKQEHEREIFRAGVEVKIAMGTTKRLAREIEEAKTKLDAAKTALAAVVQGHADAEKRESELMRKLRNLTTEESEGSVAAKANGSGTERLPLSGGLYRYGSGA